MVNDTYRSYGTKIPKAKFPEFSLEMIGNPCSSPHTVHKKPVILTSAEREVKDSRSLGAFQSYIGGPEVALELGHPNKIFRFPSLHRPIFFEK